MNERALTVEDLRVELPVPAGLVRAVQGVSFHVDCAETLSIVGGSGCGKTLTALAVMNLLGGRTGGWQDHAGAHAARATPAFHRRDMHPWPALSGICARARAQTRCAGRQARCARVAPPPVAAPGGFVECHFHDCHQLPAQQG